MYRHRQEDNIFADGSDARSVLYMTGDAQASLNPVKRYVPPYHFRKSIKVGNYGMHEKTHRSKHGDESGNLHGG